MVTQLRAAMDKVVITPEEIAPLQGYNPVTHLADPEKDLLDDLYARVLLLDDGNRRIMIVDCCLTNENAVKVADPGGRQGYYREFIPAFPAGTREKWAKAAKMNLDGISVHGTHTHTAPAHYSEKYTSRIEAMINELEKKLVPIQLSIGEGVSNISAFRRPTLHADLNIPVNQSLKVVVLETADRSPIGAIVNFAVHPTSLRNPATRLSGDLVGLAVSYVEEQFDDEFTALFIQGFSGDICPLFGDNGPVNDTYPDVVSGSRVFGFDILYAIDNRKSISATDFYSMAKTVAFPTRKQFYIPAINVEIFGICLGEIIILAVSGEVFNGYIEKIQAVSPARYTLMSGVANGYSGYMPTYSAFHDGLGGYEMNTTPYTDELESLFVGEIKQFLHQLQEKSGRNS
jgi:hypothetical protein